MTRTRGSGAWKASTSSSRSCRVRPSPVSWVLDELAEAKQPEPATAAHQLPHLRHEVGVVAAQEDVVVVGDQRLESALDADVDDLLVRVPGQRDRAVAEGQQRLDERRRQVALRGVEEEQADDRLAPQRPVRLRRRRRPAARRPGRRR